MFLRPIRYYSSSTLVQNELATFGRLSRDWWNPKGPMAALHEMNALRVPWIRDTLHSTKPASQKPALSAQARHQDNKSASLAGVRLLDVGCGAGVLSEPLARLGADVSGIDASEDVIAAAEAHRDASIQSRPLPNLQYKVETVEDLAKMEPGSYDGVVASEVVEHVGNRRLFLASCAELLKPGGLLFVTTINRTIASHIFAITIAEDVFRAVPKGTHQWHMFVPPEDLAKMVESAGLRVRSLIGLLYLPGLGRWIWQPNRSINYALVAMKPYK